MEYGLSDSSGEFIKVADFNAFCGFLGFSRARFAELVLIIGFNRSVT